MPVIALALWLLLHSDFELPRRAFLWTLATLLPLGFGLDLFFGATFFNFPATDSIVGLCVPGYQFDTRSWSACLPIEEFIFYVSGFLVTLLMYLWLDEYWLGRYDVGDTEPVDGGDQGPLLGLHWPSLVVGIVVLTAGLVFEALLARESDGFPGYFVFLVLCSVLPTALLYRGVAAQINWRALSLTLFLMLLVSLLWEATLASPYGWWRYNEDMMLGIFVGAWSRLPVEAVLVWIMVTFTTVMFYETVRRVLSRMQGGSSLRQAILGTGS